MLETPEYPSPSRIKPLPNEKPVAGFSWADYEDVRVATDGGENDADGEDDGWGVVTSKRPSEYASCLISSTDEPLVFHQLSFVLVQRENYHFIIDGVTSFFATFKGI
jgi:hypothetical protein